MIKVFSEPYPCPSSAKQRWIISFGIGLGVFAFLYIFKPFGLGGHAQLLQVALSYGLISLLVCLFCQFVFPATFPVWFDEKNWTVGKHILFSAFIFFAVGIANFLYSNLQGFIPLNLKGFLYFQLITLLVGVFPFSLMVLTSYTWFLRRNLQSAGIIRKAIHSSHLIQGSDTVRLPSESKDDDLLVPLSDLFYIASVDNYVEVTYSRQGKLKKKLLRNTLNAIQSLTDRHPQLFRCHRAYLVNLMQVSDIVGNSQGCKLILSEMDEQIPVSRGQYKKLREKLESL